MAHPAPPCGAAGRPPSARRAGGPGRVLRFSSSLTNGGAGPPRGGNSWELVSHWGGGRRTIRRLAEKLPPGSAAADLGGPGRAEPALSGLRGGGPRRLCSRTLSLVAPALVLPWLGRPLPVSFPAARAFCPVVPLRGAARRRFPAFEISQRRVPSGRPRLFPRPRLQPLCLGSEDLEQRPLGHLSCLPGLSLWCQKVGPAV